MPAAFLCADVTAELGELVCMPRQYKKLGEKKKSASLALAQLPQVCFGVKRGWSWLFSCVTGRCTRLNLTFPSVRSTHQCKKSNLGCFCPLGWRGVWRSPVTPRLGSSVITSRIAESILSVHSWDLLPFFCLTLGS